MKCTSVTHFNIINHVHHVRSTRFHGKEEHRQCATSCCRSTRHTVNVKGQSESSSNMPPVYSNLPFLHRTFSICPFFDKNKSTQKQNKACQRSLTSSPLLNKSSRCCKVNIFRVNGTVNTPLFPIVEKLCFPTMNCKAIEKEWPTHAEPFWAILPYNFFVCVSRLLYPYASSPC